MFYNRSKDPDNPFWIGIRGSSRIEGGHSYYHASLPGTNYSADLGGAILACRLADASIKASARNKGTAAVSLDDAYYQYRKQQLCTQHGWDYALPTSVDVPDLTDELFGPDYVVTSATLEQATAQMKSDRVQAARLAEEKAMEAMDTASIDGTHYCMFSMLLFFSSGMHCVAIW